MMATEGIEWNSLNAVMRVFRVIILCPLISLLVACHSSPPVQKVLFDFESEAELDRFHWKCHTLFSLSDEYATHGYKSLRLEIYPADFPGLEPMLEDNDWRGFDQLAFDVFNNTEKDINLTIRIDDRSDAPDYVDRYNNSVVLKPGMNTVVVPFHTLITSGTLRKLDLMRIYSLLVFMAHPNEKHVLYFDYFRLS